MKFYYAQMHKIIFVIAIVPRFNFHRYLSRISQYPIIFTKSRKLRLLLIYIYIYIYRLGCYSFTITRQKPTLHAFRALIRLQCELCDKHEFCWNLLMLTYVVHEFLRDEYRYFDYIFIIPCPSIALPRNNSILYKFYFSYFTI